MSDIVEDCREIHSAPCERCPSMHGDDPEAREIRHLYRQGKIPVWDAIFLCAWRREKNCYGICLKARVTEADLQGAVQHVL